MGAAVPGERKHQLLERMQIGPVHQDEGPSLGGPQEMEQRSEQAFRSQLIVAQEPLDAFVAAFGGHVARHGPSQREHAHPLRELRRAYDGLQGLAARKTHALYVGDDPCQNLVQVVHGVSLRLASNSQLETIPNAVTPGTTFAYRPNQELGITEGSPNLIARRVESIERDVICWAAYPVSSAPLPRLDQSGIRSVFFKLFPQTGHDPVYVRFRRIGPEPAGRVSLDRKNPRNLRFDLGDNSLHGQISEGGACLDCSSFANSVLSENTQEKELATIKFQGQKTIDTQFADLVFPQTATEYYVVVCGQVFGHQSPQFRYVGLFACIADPLLQILGQLIEGFGRIFAFEHFDDAL